MLRASVVIRTQDTWRARYADLRERIEQFHSEEYLACAVVDYRPEETMEAHYLWHALGIPKAILALDADGCYKALLHAKQYARPADTKFLAVLGQQQTSMNTMHKVLNPCNWDGARCPEMTWLGIPVMTFEQAFDPLILNERPQFTQSG